MLNYMSICHKFFGACLNILHSHEMLQFVMPHDALPHVEYGIKYIQPSSTSKSQRLDGSFMWLKYCQKELPFISLLTNQLINHYKYVLLLLEDVERK